MRIPLRRRWHKLRRQRLPPALLAAVIALALFILLWRAVDDCLTPAIETIAASSAVNRISETVSRAVADCVSREQLTYQDFISLETDASGKVTSLTSNLSAASQLRSQLVSSITAELDELRQEEFGVPLGTLTGWLVFSGKGPVVQVDLLSVGDVTVELRHSFGQAGINQTLHQVFLEVSATVYLMIPGETLPVTSDSQVCVAETVIVGEVPDTYLYVGNGEQ